MKKRHLESHKATNDWLEINVLDEPGPGGACHRYCIYHPCDDFNEELNASMSQHIHFQKGPILENGVNGVTQEALLAIVIDRLECFQAGDYANDYNQQALEHCRSALDALKGRTEERIARGVEGTSQV